MVFSVNDLKILRAFYISSINGDKNLTSWKIMKKIYPKGGDRNHTEVRRILIDLHKRDVINYSNKEGFTLIKDNIKIDELPTVKKCVSIKIENKWIIQED